MSLGWKLERMDERNREPEREEWKEGRERYFSFSYYRRGNWTERDKSRYVRRLPFQILVFLVGLSGACCLSLFIYLFYCEEGFITEQ